MFGLYAKLASSFGTFLTILYSSSPSIWILSPGSRSWMVGLSWWYNQEAVFFLRCRLSFLSLYVIAVVALDKSNKSNAPLKSSPLEILNGSVKSISGFIAVSITNFHPVDVVSQYLISPIVLVITFGCPMLNFWYTGALSLPLMSDTNVLYWSLPVIEIVTSL